METNEIKNLEQLKKLITPYFNTFNSSTDKKRLYSAKIEVLNYSELASIIINMLKMCILAIDQDMHKVSEINKAQPINVSLILEIVLEMFPSDEFEVLDDINKMLIADS